MNALLNDETPFRATLDRLVEHHGLWAVARALMARALRRDDMPRVHVRDLPPRMLRDIGMHEPSHPPDGWPMR